MKKTKNSLMLSKKEFVACLKFMYSQEKKEKQFVSALENLCPGNYCDCWLYNDYAEEYRKLIEKIMNDQDKDISYFLFELDKGKDAAKHPDVPYHNEEELYDYLVMKELSREE